MNVLSLLLLFPSGDQYDIQAQEAVRNALVAQAAANVVAEVISDTPEVLSETLDVIEFTPDDEAELSVKEELEAIRKEIAEIRANQTVTPIKNDSVSEPLTYTKLGPVIYGKYSAGWTWSGDLREHIQESPHNLDKVSAETLPAADLISIHDANHNGGTRSSSSKKYTTPASTFRIFQGSSNCPNGQCPTQSYRVRRR